MKTIHYAGRSTSISLYFLILFCFPVVLSAQAEEWLLEPENHSIEIVESIIKNSKKNYENIKTWQGSLSIHEENNYFGESGQKYIKNDSPAAKSQHIRRDVDLKGEFRINLTDNKLNSNLEPKVEWAAVDLGQKAPLREEISYSRMRAIVTDQQYFRYDPDLNFSYPTNFILSSETAGKTVFINPPEEAKGQLSGDIRDPREFFKVGGDFAWKSFSKIIKQIEEHGNIPIGKEKVLRVWSKQNSEEELYKIELNLKLSEQNDSYSLKQTFQINGSLGSNIQNVTVEDSTGRTLYIESIAYEKKDGVFVPSAFERIVFGVDGKVDYQSHTEIHHSEINTTIPESMFTLEALGLEDGIRVTDRINKVEYWYREGKLVVADAKTEQILLKEIDKEPDIVNVAKKEVFLPKPVYALKAGKPYIFDFASEQFVKVPIKDIASKEIYDYLVENKKGDIAWNSDGLLGLRKGKLVIDEKQKKEIQHIAEEWCNWYDFSKVQKFPFMLKFMTSSGVNYELTIIEIRSDGAKIGYKKIP